MTKTRRLLVLPLILAVAACGDSSEGAQGERKTAAGEVLGGSISDAMLPLDKVTSQGPPLRESGSGSSERKPSSEPADAPEESEDAADASGEAEAAPAEE